MNRVWRPDGTEEIDDDPRSVAAREAMRHLLGLDLAAAADLQNTTGANPFMMTRAVAAARADCLSYLLARLDARTGQPAASHSATSIPSNRSPSGTRVTTSDASSS